MMLAGRVAQRSPQRCGACACWRQIPTFSKVEFWVVLAALLQESGIEEPQWQMAWAARKATRTLVALMAPKEQRRQQNMRKHDCGDTCMNNEDGFVFWLYGYTGRYTVI